MGINIAGGADIAVPQPLLNFLQAHAVGVKQAGTTMAQIVKTDTLHLMCDQKIWEMLAQKVGPNPFSHRVYMPSLGTVNQFLFPLSTRSPHQLTSYTYSLESSNALAVLWSQPS